MTKDSNKAEIERMAKVLRDRDAFPVADFEQFLAALGGGDARVSFDGRPYKVRKFARDVPAQFFPISSEDDFRTKASELEGYARRVKEGKKGKRLDAPKES